MRKNHQLLVVTALVVLLFALAGARTIAGVSTHGPGTFVSETPLSHELLASQTGVPRLDGPVPLNPGPAGAAESRLATPMPISLDRGQTSPEALSTRLPEEAMNPLTTNGTRPPPAPALAPTPNPRARKLSEADSGAQIELAGDQPLEVTLPANWSTGYRWEVAQADQDVLRLAAQVQELGAPGMMGAPGYERLTFQAVGPGTTTLGLVYRRPWQQMEPAGTFTVDVSTQGPFYPFSPYESPSSSVQPQVAPAAPVALPSVYNVCQQGGGCLPIEDQGQCGSCWSFASTGAVENELNILHSAHVNGSEQYLVSCNVDGWGCQGGNPFGALDYYISKVPSGEPAAGLVYEADAPYFAFDAPCGGPYQHHEKIQSWSFIDPNSSIPAPALIKQAIYDHGPVVAGICAGTAMQSYTGGVFRTDESSQCGPSSGNHAILLVGWDDSTQSWILRNSWGAGWGESGYMHIGFGVSSVGLYAAYVVDAGAAQNTPTPPPAQWPNLVPYQPSGWDYPVVPANVTGGNHVTTLYAGQPTYIDIAVANTGSTSAGAFQICLYLDGVEINRWQSNGLASGYYASASDWSYTVATGGQHALKLVADCAASVAESNENDNSWEHTFTWVGTSPTATLTPSPTAGSPRSNLLPYQPNGWDYPIVPANVTGGNRLTPLYAGQPTYIDLAVANTGNADAGAYFVCLYLDDAEISRWQSTGLPSGYYNYVTDWSYTVATPGEHTLKIVADCTNAIVESNESDNAYQRTFNWVSSPPTSTPTPSPTAPAGPLPDLRPYAPSGWDYPIVPANVISTTHLTMLYAGQPTYIDWALANYGNTGTGAFYICLYLDGTEIGLWQSTGLPNGYYVSVTDWSYMVATPGDHTLKTVADCTNLVTESDESNNSYEHTFTWVGTGLTPSPTPTTVVHLPTETPTATRNPPTVTPTSTPSTTPPAGSAVVKVNPASKTMPLGGTDAGVDIVVENAANVGAYQVDLLYNPNIVSVLEVKAGPFLGSTGRTVMPLSSIDNTTGLATFGANTIGAQPGASGSGVLATVKLQPKAKGSTALSLQNLLLLKPSGESLPASTQGGQLVVSNCLGDFDGNGVVDIRDLQAAASHWNCRTGDACYDAQYDVYPSDQPDGRVDISDIQRVAAVWNTHCTASSATGQELTPGGAIQSPALSPMNLQLAPSNPAVGVGSVFTLTIGAQNAYNLGGFQTDIRFDPAKAQVITATIGPFLGSTGRSVSPLGPTIDNTTGRLTLGAFTFGSNRAPSGAGDLAYIQLRAVSAGTLPVTFDQPSVTDPLGNPVELGEVTGSSVLIDGKRTYLPALLKN
jgi:C1A family cysteine protease